jgi:hypothetical protein
MGEKINMIFTYISNSLNMFAPVSDHGQKRFFLSKDPISKNSWITAKQDWGHMVAQLVEASCYKPKGCGFDCDIGNFYWHNPSSHPVVLESTQSLIEMSTRNISWG